MNKSLLPIGSIITVSNVDLMICAYVKKGKLINNIQYDYVCCHYPIGIEEQAILTKKEDITNIKFIGYQDNNFDTFKKEYGDKL